MSSLKGARLKVIESGKLSSAVVVGRVLECTPDGRIIVDYPSNSLGPMEARTLIEDLMPGAMVLLAFELGMPKLPIVLGIVYDRAKKASRTFHVRAERIILEASEELSMHCGEGSFQTRRNGDIRLKGRDIVSRATRTNKVRGASVLLN